MKKTLERQRANALLDLLLAHTHGAEVSQRAVTGALAQGDTVVAELLRAKAWAKTTLADAARQALLELVDPTEDA